MVSRRTTSASACTDPVTFAETVLGLHIWDKQADLLRLVANNKRVACRAGHKVSKSCSASILSLWWPIAHPNGRVILTATTNPQIRNVLWKECRRLRHCSKIPYPDMAELPAIGMQWPDGREIIGFSTKESERMAGLSGSEMLFIVDEASGVPEVIYEAIEGNRAGGAHVLLIGNPTQPTGTFYDAFHSKAAFWKTIHISSIEAAQYEPHIPGLATSEWIDEKRQEWGESDPRFQVRVLGNFADSHECSVVSLYHVEAAQDRYDDPEERAHARGRLEIGCDPARFGDDETVIAVRRGKRIVDMVIGRQLDEHAVARLVEETVRRHRANDEQPALVKVDECGVGAGVVSVLRTKSGPDCPFVVIGVDAGSAADNEEEHFNRRAQLWFGVADWLKDGGQIPRDSKLEGDLLSAHYSFDPKNRLKVEKKEDIKKRIGRSPDRADAIALAVHFSAPRMIRPVSARPEATYRFSGMGRGY